MNRVVARSALCVSDSSFGRTRDTRIREFIQQQYQETFAADVSVGYPNLLGLIDNEGQILSAIGYRDGKSALFVEHYMDKPIEQWIMDTHGRYIEREHVVELGNLASLSTRHTIVLLQQAWSILQLKAAAAFM